MPIGIYKRTAEHKRRLREHILGQWKTKKFKSAVIEFARSRVGNRNSHWKGGRLEKKNGYIIVLSPGHPYASIDGYVLEHRLVVEKQIGRNLLPEERVHHLGDINDNRPHRLMAFVNQAAHNRFERGCEIRPEEIIYDGRNHG